MAEVETTLGLFAERLQATPLAVRIDKVPNVHAAKGHLPYSRRRAELHALCCRHHKVNVKRLRKKLKIRGHFSVL